MTPSLVRSSRSAAGPVALVLGEEPVDESQDLGALLAPEHWPADEPAGLVVVADLRRDLTHPGAVVLGPPLVGARLRLGGPGEDVVDEGLEDLVHQGPPIGRRDRELLRRIVDWFDLQQVVGEVGEWARRPRLEAGRTKHPPQRRGDVDPGEVAVEARELAAVASPDDAGARPHDGFGRGAPAT